MVTKFRRVDVEVRDPLECFGENVDHQSMNRWSIIRQNTYTRMAIKVEQNGEFIECSVTWKERRVVSEYRSTIKLPSSNVYNKEKHRDTR